MDLITKLLEIKKIPKSVVFAVFIAVALLLYLPIDTLEKLELKTFKMKYGEYLGIILLISFIMGITIGIPFIQSSIIFERRRKISLRRSIKELDYQEKAALREFYMQNKNTIPMPIDDPIVSGLIWKGILCQIGNLGRLHHCYGMMMNIAITTKTKKILTNANQGLKY